MAKKTKAGAKGTQTLIKSAGKKLSGLMDTLSAAKKSVGKTLQSATKQGMDALKSRSKSPAKKRAKAKRPVTKKKSAAKSSRKPSQASKITGKSLRPKRSPASKTTPRRAKASSPVPKIPNPAMMGDGTEEQNLNQPGNPGARITQDEVDAAFKKPD